jgi:hypothetical protein
VQIILRETRFFQSADHAPTLPVYHPSNSLSLSGRPEPDNFFELEPAIGNVYFLQAFRHLQFYVGHIKN